MIVPGPTSLGKTMRYVGWPLAALFAWDLVVTICYVVLHLHRLDVPSLPLPLLGSALVVFLAFRNTTAYARWWEARTLWGAAVNASRAFARDVVALMQPAGQECSHALVRRQIAYVHALRGALRRQPAWDDVARFLDAAEIDTLKQSGNVADRILTRTAVIIGQAREAGLLDSIRQTRLAAVLAEIGNAQGGMERIKNTPPPIQYRVLSRLFTQCVCILLPVGLVAGLGLYTPLASTVVGFMLLALERVADHAESPFENTVFDVPLTALCRTIEIDLLHAIGAEAVPPPLAPVGGVLW